MKPFSDLLRLDLMDYAHGDRALNRKTSPASNALRFNTNDWNNPLLPNPADPSEQFSPHFHDAGEGIKRGALRRKSMALAHAIYSDLSGIDPGI
ncbi:hypothetical protein Ciccas_008855 [Cichlidogyrus casuarinus]|uniref:Uncharacterized protein n=1 Tax=Cichlidogyrus casuarinus TaxID=1844966 RepID=A0ABD2PYP9_9PLAT